MSNWSDISFATFVLVAARMAGMMFGAPFFSAKVITVRFRIVLCLLVSFSVFPLFANIQQVSFDGVGQLASQSIGEFIIGALFGLAVHVIFKAMLFAGELIGTPLGLSQATDQNSEASTSMGRLFDLIAITVFILIGGPGLLVSSIIESMMVMPLGADLPNSENLRQLLAAVPLTFGLGLKIALPVLICQMLAVMLVGVMSRSIPQLSMWQVGLPLTAAATLIGVMLSIGAAAIFFGEQIETATENFMSQIFTSTKG